MLAIIFTLRLLHWPQCVHVLEDVMRMVLPEEVEEEEVEGESHTVVGQVKLG